MSLAHNSQKRLRISAVEAKRLRVSIRHILEKDQLLTLNERELLATYAKYRIDSVASWRHDSRIKAFQIATGDILNKICGIEREGKLDSAFIALENGVHTAIMARKQYSLRLR